MSCRQGGHVFTTSSFSYPLACSLLLSFIRPLTGAVGCVDSEESQHWSASMWVIDAKQALFPSLPIVTVPSVHVFVSDTSFSCQRIPLQVPECIIEIENLHCSQIGQATAGAQTLEDVWNYSDQICDPAVRQDEKGRIFPRKIRRNPGAKKEVERR